MANNTFLRVFALLYFSITIGLAPVAFKILFLTPNPDSEPIPSNSRSATWGWTVLLVGKWVYSVVTMEQIILRNGVTEVANRWTYGQTLSMALLIGPVFDLMSGIWRKKHERGVRERVREESMRERG
jgi:hypothetical protein